MGSAAVIMPRSGYETTGFSNLGWPYSVEPAGTKEDEGKGTGPGDGQPKSKGATVSTSQFPYHSLLSAGPVFMGIS